MSGSKPNTHKPSASKAATESAATEKVIAKKAAGEKDPSEQAAAKGADVKDFLLSANLHVDGKKMAAGTSVQLAEGQHAELLALGAVDQPWSE